MPPDDPENGDWNVLLLAQQAADRINKFAEIGFKDLVSRIVNARIVGKDRTLPELRSAVQKAEIGTDDLVANVFGAVPGFWQLVSQLASWHWGYGITKPAEYTAKKQALIEIPEPGSLIAAMIRTGHSCEPGSDEGTYKDGLIMQGYGWPSRLILEHAARTRLDPRSYWRYKQRKASPAAFNPMDAYRRAGLFKDDLEIFAEVQWELLPNDLIARLLWRGVLGPEEVRSLLAERGVHPDYRDRLLSMLESVLPPELAVRGFYRGEFDLAESVKRLYATGLREEDAVRFVALSASLMPPDLAMRGFWRGLWDRGTASRRIRGLGFDAIDAENMTGLMSELMGAGDLSRLLYAGNLDIGGYVAGLKRLGLDPDDADRLGSYPWQPIPASETMRLLWAGKLGTARATAALRTTGLPPPVADAITAWPWRATSPEFAHRLFDRGVIDSKGVADRLVAGGMNPADAKRISLVFQDPLPVDALFQLHRRGLIDKDEVVRGIGHQGYSAFDAEKFAELCWVVPSPQDVISFAVRDVFEHDVVDHFGYADEFPPEFVKWAKKAGITEEVALLYWYAHWYVPGIDEVMSMFHRIKPGQQALPRDQRETWVTDADVDMYLKTKDVPLWWRDKVKAVAFHPISRVDIRRAYRAGLAGEEDVYETNRALGYSHRDSEILTEWTKSEYMEGQQALLEERVTDGLVDGTLTSEEAVAILATSGMPAHRIRLLVDWAGYDRERKKKDLSRSTVQKLYVEGYIDAANVRVRLAALRYGGEEVELLLGLWTVDRDYNAAVTAGRKARPSRAQVLVFWKDSVIDEGVWEGEMEGLGYADHYIEWFKTHALLKWSDDEITESYLSGFMTEGTAVWTLYERGWPPEKLYSLVAARRERE